MVVVGMDYGMVGLGRVGYNIMICGRKLSCGFDGGVFPRLKVPSGVGGLL